MIDKNPAQQAACLPNSFDIRRSPKGARPRSSTLWTWLRRIVLPLSDALMFGLAWALATKLGTSTQSFWGTGRPLNFLLVIMLGLSMIAVRGLYKAGYYRRNYCGLVYSTTMASILLLFVIYFYAPGDFISRSQFLLFWILSSLFVCIGRLGADFFVKSVRQRGGMRIRAMIIADPHQQPRASNLVEGEQRYNTLSVLDARCLDRANRPALFEQLQKLGVSEVFASWDSLRNRMFLGQWFQNAGIKLHILPLETDYMLDGAKISSLDHNSLPCFTFTPPAIVGIDYWVKRTFDLCFASAFVFLTLPIYLGIALAIKLDSPGPIFYRQTRIGLHGEPFKVWKFRSMVQNAAELQAKLEAQNQNKDGVLFKMKDDPRITRVGTFIRKYSLDELPQMFNVLLGDMSVVGPRPLPMRDVERFQHRHFIRQDVLPGITGLWQVSGRSDIDNFEDVLKLDLYYIQNWSIWLDIEILFRTFNAVLMKAGAY